MIGNMINGELLFRPAREIFAGIIILFQGNLPTQGGRRIVI